MKLPLLALSAALAFSAVPCFAAEPYDELNDWPVGSAAHTSIVARRELELQETRLNGLYRKLISARFTNTSTKAARKALRDSRKAWTAYRDHNCAMWGELDGGVSPWKTAKELVCKADETGKRVKELERLLADTTE